MFDPAERVMAALPVPAALDRGEAGVVQALGQRLGVVEELMSPAAERLVHPEAIANGLTRLRPLAEVVLRHPDPVEIRRGEAEYAVVGQHAAAVAEELHRVVIREVLDEVLGE